MKHNHICSHSHSLYEDFGAGSVPNAAGWYWDLAGVCCQIIHFLERRFCTKLIATCPVNNWPPNMWKFINFIYINLDLKILLLCIEKGTFMKINNKTNGKSGLKFILHLHL